MISRCTSNDPKEENAFRRLLYHKSTCSKGSHRHFQDCSRHSWSGCQCCQACVSALWLVTSTPRYSLACHQHSEVLPRLSPDFLCPPTYCASAPRCTWSPLHRSSILCNVMTHRFWSNNSQRLVEAPRGSQSLPEAPSDSNTFCWCCTDQAALTSQYELLLQLHLSLL